MATTSFVRAIDRTMLLHQLDLASRHFTESEHRVTRQQHLIAKLRVKRQTTTLAVEYLRGLQVSRAIHLASRNRIQRALARLDEVPATTVSAT